MSGNTISTEKKQELGQMFFAQKWMGIFLDKEKKTLFGVIRKLCPFIIVLSSSGWTVFVVICQYIQAKSQGSDGGDFSWENEQFSLGMFLSLFVKSFAIFHGNRVVDWIDGHSLFFKICYLFVIFDDSSRKSQFRIFNKKCLT